jgi:transcriptional regulator with XRE-family HTH domain
MVHWIATQKAPYQYSLSGLKNVYLSGIVVHECPDCRAALPVIPRVEELHDLIARDLASKRGLLSGDEIKFLRKNAGFPAAKFAALLGVDPAHLSRIENGHTDALGESADRLARAIAMIAKDGDAAREVLLEMADEMEAREPLRKPRHKPDQRPLFRLVKGRNKGRKWLRAA